jgi:hypothetical protein
MTLDEKTLESRIAAAKNFKLGLDHIKTEPIEVAIKAETVRNFGYDQLKLTQDTPLYKKDGQQGLFLINTGCPVAASLEEAKQIAEKLLPKASDVLAVLNSKFRTEYQNKVRSFLNAPAASKKAEKQAAIDELTRKFENGEITAAVFAEKMKALV